MGCLNSTCQFDHWFGNIHLSGPCNRKCYFCIGQHMMAVDSFDMRTVWPLPGFDEFIAKCRERNVLDVYVTGTNTDPLLYNHLGKLAEAIKAAGFVAGIRTNGIGWWRTVGEWFDKGSVTMCSADEAINRSMMGGPPPNVATILRDMPDLKVNIVLGPENVRGGDVFRTIKHCIGLGVNRLNLREPYGQPHVGDPMKFYPGFMFRSEILGMPRYSINGSSVTYWDVHYVEVESVNLYANGHISLSYPVTRGVDFDHGAVRPQSEFPGGRVQKQWQSVDEATGKVKMVPG